MWLSLQEFWGQKTCIHTFILLPFYINNESSQRFFVFVTIHYGFILHNLLKHFLILFMLGDWPFIILITFIDLLPASWKDLHLLLKLPSSIILPLNFNFSEFVQIRQIHQPMYFMTLKNFNRIPLFKSFHYV